MLAAPYPTTREAHRLKRWLETAGAESRLVTAVGVTAATRDLVEESVLGAGGFQLVPLDITTGDVVPASFREHRGSHTTYRLFVFSGLHRRLLADGRAATDALEANEALFRRPATWALFWLEDPLLVALLPRLAPRFSAAIQLHPTFPDVIEAEASPLAPLLASIIPRSLAGGAGGEAAVDLLLERGDLAGARRMLRERPFPVAAALLGEADADLLAGDVQSALARFVAAAALGGERAAEAAGGASEILARLGDAGAALAFHARYLAAKPGLTPRAAVRRARVDLVLARLGRGEALGAIAAARAAARQDPFALRALARAVAEIASDHDLAADLLDEARRSAAGPSLAVLEVELGLALGHRGPKHATAARELLARHTDPAAAGGAQVAAMALRGLTRLDLESGSLVAAEETLGRALELARGSGLTSEQIECLWERAALAAAREDLGLVLETVAAIRALAATAGLKPVVFDAIEKHARGLRFARALGQASGELDELESLAYDLTLPELEIRAHRARADHLAELGLPGEARTSGERAAAVAAAIGADRASGTLAS